jgi:protein-disulfide isomerase
MSSQSKIDPLMQPDEDTDHILGSATARVAVIEYGDFTSAACAQAYSAVQILLREYPHELRFVYRHYPETEVRAHAELAAEAAEAVGAQGHFWSFYELLFEHQDHLKEKALRQYADQVGADLVRYDHEMHNRVYRQRVHENANGARHLGVRSMPAFFVDGHLTDVSFGLEHLEKAVAKQMRGAG